MTIFTMVRMVLIRNAVLLHRDCNLLCLENGGVENAGHSLGLFRISSIGF